MGRRGRLSLIDYTRYFVTTTIVDFLPVFRSKECCDLLISNIRFYQDQYHFTIFGFVIMPTHFQWLLEVNPTYGFLSDIMRDIKKYSAWDIMDLLEREGRDDYMRRITKAAAKSKDQKRKFWMKRFDDAYIRNNYMFGSTLDYIHNNPVKAGLVNRPEDYVYSSARNYILGDHSVLEVNTELVQPKCFLRRVTVGP